MSTKSQDSDFRDILKHLFHSRDIRRVFDAFVRLSVYALAAQTREPEYLEEARHWERVELESFGNALGALIAEMEVRTLKTRLKHSTWNAPSLRKDRNGMENSARQSMLVISWRR